MVSYDCQLIKCKVIIAELRYTGKVRTGQGNHNRSFGLTDFALADLLGRGRSIAAPQQKNRARRRKGRRGVEQRRTRAHRMSLLRKRLRCAISCSTASRFNEHIVTVRSCPSCESESSWRQTLCRVVKRGPVSNETTTPADRNRLLQLQRVSRCNW